MSAPEVGSSSSSRSGRADQRARQEDPLLLAAREVADVAPRAVADAQPLQQLVHRVAVGLARPRERPGLGRQPHQHDLLDGDREAPVDRLKLRHVADADLPARAGRREADGAVVDLGHAEHRPQHGRLAGAARPDDPGELARIQAQRDAVPGPGCRRSRRRVVKLDERLVGAVDAAGCSQITPDLDYVVGSVLRSRSRLRTCSPGRGCRAASGRRQGRRPSAARRTSASRRRCSRASPGSPGGSSSRSSSK